MAKIEIIPERSLGKPSLQFCTALERWCLAICFGRVGDNAFEHTEAEQLSTAKACHRTDRLFRPRYLVLLSRLASYSLQSHERA